MIREYYPLLKNDDVLDQTYPNALCSSCVSSLYRYKNKEGPSLPFIKACAYTNLGSMIHTSSLMQIDRK